MALPRRGDRGFQMKIIGLDAWRAFRALMPPKTPKRSHLFVELYDASGEKVALVEEHVDKVGDAEAVSWGGKVYRYFDGRLGFAMFREADCYDGTLLTAL
jgi:hypothetical protein